LFLFNSTIFPIYTYLSILVKLERSWFSRFPVDTIKPLTGKKVQRYLCAYGFICVRINTIVHSSAMLGMTT